MSDPKAARHEVRMVLEIDGQQYAMKFEPLKVGRTADIHTLANHMADITRTTVETHFGLGMTPIN